MALKSRITARSNMSEIVRGRIPALGAGGGQVIEKVLEQVGIDAVVLGRRIIQTTPSSIVPGKMDRVDTGRMLNEVNYMVTHTSKYNYNLYAGWLRGDPKDYFELQDEGGTARWGQEIEGMFMLAAMREYIRSNARREIADAIHRQ